MITTHTLTCIPSIAPQTVEQSFVVKEITRHRRWYPYHAVPKYITLYVIWRVLYLTVVVEILSDHVCVVAACNLCLIKLVSEVKVRGPAFAAAVSHAGRTGIYKDLLHVLNAALDSFFVLTNVSGSLGAALFIFSVIGG